MKLFFALIAGLGLALGAKGQYSPIDAGSSVTFKVKNFGFNTDGSFKGLKGTINFDPANLTQASFNITLDASTINTDNTLRDEHLRDESFFDVKNHPAIQFVSTQITASGKSGGYQVKGNLTLKGVTKSITFPFTATATPDRCLFKGSFKINREDFGVGSSATISNSVEIFLEVLARRN